MLEPKPHLATPILRDALDGISKAGAFTSSSSSVMLCRCGFGGVVCVCLCAWILLRRTFHFALVLLYLASYTNFHVSNIVYL